MAASTTANKALAAELTQHFHGRHLYPTAAWIQSFIATTRPNTPLPAVKQTALFRLLATDLTTTYAQSAPCVFPSDVVRGQTQSRIVAGPVVCQVLDIEDVGHSRWSQVEAIEARERGETTKGREIVRVVEPENESTSEPSAQPQSKGPFKLLLQDARGLKIFAYDLRGIDGLHTNMAIGLKLIVRNVNVCRGIAMLEHDSTQVLGGKIESLDKAWKQARKERLMAAARGTHGSAV